MDTLLKSLDQIIQLHPWMGFQVETWSSWVFIETHSYLLLQPGGCSSNLPTNTSYLSVFSANAGKYGPEKTPYLDTFHTMILEISVTKTTQKKLGINNLVSKRPYHIKTLPYRRLQMWNLHEKQSMYISAKDKFRKSVITQTCLYFHTLSSL